jgi:hypothetical protein
MLWKFGQGRHGNHWKDQVTTCFFLLSLCFPVSHSTLSKLPDSHPTETLHYLPEFSKHKDASAQAHVKSNLSNLIPEVLAEPYAQWHGLLCC